jgi:CubicO group peptidase (beta-lactamase class C family)
MQAVVDKGHLNGIQVLLARRDMPFHFASFGWQDKENDVSMADDTIFRLYSMTKPIVSVAAMMLFEEGRLQIADPVGAYLPAFHNLKVYVDQNTTANLERPVLVRDLLMHTAGLTKVFDESHPVDRMYADANVLDRQLPPNEALDRLCQIPLVFQPGSQWHYSIATNVLGWVVSVVTGKSLGESLNEMIFKPLGMKDTRFQVPEEDLGRLAVNYQTNHYGRLEPMPGPDRDPVVTGVKTESGGGGLAGTTADYFRFAQMLLNEGTLDGVRLLGPRTVRYMATDHLKQGMEVFGNMDGGYGAYGFGLGFRVLKTPGRHRHLSGGGEYGWVGAANTYFWIDPDADLLGIFMSQLMPSGLHDVARMFQSQTYAALND